MGDLSGALTVPREAEHLTRVEVDTRYTLFILHFLAFLPIGVNILGEHCLEKPTSWLSNAVTWDATGGAPVHHE